MATIQIRIDEKTKHATKKILDKLSIDMSTAIKIYFKQIIMHKGIPFPILTENGFTTKQEREILKIARDARKGKNVTKPMDIKEAIEYLDRLK